MSCVDGLSFEAEIQRIVRQALHPDGKNIWVVDTPRTGDRGKDIVIHFKRGISVLGMSFGVPRSAEVGTLYIECKKTDAHTLSPGSFGGSLLQLGAEGQTPNYFLLVTNAALTPELHHNSRERFRLNGCIFRLVDRRRLATLLQNDSTALPAPNAENTPTVAVCYSVFDRDSMRCLLSSPSDTEGKRGKRKVLEAFVAIDNYTGETRNVRLSLRSDINWLISPTVSDGAEEEQYLNFFISPFETRTTKLRLEQQSFDGMDGLRLGLNVDGRSRTLEVRGSRLDFDFDPPLFGSGHQHMVDRIQDAICADIPATFISLCGDAGTGKSKILEELAERLRGSDRYLSRIELRPGFHENSLGQVIEDLAGVNGGARSSPSSIGAFFEFLEHVGDQYAHYVICLEDLHHAHPALLASLQTFVSRATTCRVTIIGTGRADGTFANDHYFALLDHFAIGASSTSDVGLARTLTLSLHRWSDEDCRNFIRATVVEAPDIVVDRIHQLSENTPFGAIQAIEYLLDLDIVRVVNRNTVGVTNATEFGGKLDVPKGLSDLIALRCNHLVHLSSRRGPILLVALATLGMEVTADIVRRLVRDGEDDEALMVAEQQKFLKVSDERVRFLHENLQVFFLGRLEDHSDGVEAARKLLAIADMIENPYQIGVLRLIAKQPEAAFECLEPLWLEHTKTTNISSINMRATELQYISPLVKAAKALNKPADAIARLCVNEMYGMLHNASLAVALKTAQRQCEIIEHLELSGEKRNAFMLELRQLEAHILLNMGHILSAQKIMLEIAAKAAMSPQVSANHRLMFDVFDRLQSIYHKLNHRNQFINYSDLSRREVEAADDDKLMALVLSSRAKEHVFEAPSTFLEKTEMATKWARCHASRRHICHAEMNLCIARLIANPTDREGILAQIATLSDLLADALKNAYSFSITRAELSLANAYALLGLDKPEYRHASERYARIGIESCLRFGNGFFLGLLHNVLAMIELEETDSNLERVAGHWQTALHYLDQQGLLFLGNLDSCCPNLAVITNIIRFVYEHEGDKATRKLIDRLRFYDSGRQEPAARYRTLLRSVLEHDLIGRTRPLPVPMREPATGYMIAMH